MRAVPSPKEPRQNIRFPGSCLYTAEARANIHLRQVYGDEAHHVCEGLFKSFARALRQAKAIDPLEKGVPSSKGVI